MKRKYTLLFFAILLVLGGMNCNKMTITSPDLLLNPVWPQLGKNIQHTNYSNEEISLPLELLWRHRAITAIGRSLIAGNNIIFYSSLEGRIQSVRLQDGKSLDKLKQRGQSKTTCALYNDNLIVQRRIGLPSLELYNLITGKSRWQVQNSYSFSEPLVHQHTIYTTDVKSNLNAYSAVNGKELWSRPLSGQSRSTPTYAQGFLFVGDDNGVFYAFNTEGDTVWTFKAQGSIRFAATADENSIYFGSTDFNFYALNIATGLPKWRFETDGKIYNGAALHEDKIIFGSTDHLVYCLDKNTGDTIWEFQASSVISTAPVIAKNIVFIGSLDKNMYALDLNTGEKLWSFEAKGRIRTDPIVVNERLIFASENHYLYCFGKK